MALQPGHLAHRPSGTARLLLAAVLDTYRASVAERMNEVMKVLTVMASIFIPLTFLAGIYGMNFNTESSPLNMPELDHIDYYFSDLSE